MPATDWEKRQVFAKEYAASGNGTQAAITAGVPAKSAHAVAYKWLHNTEILALVREEVDARMRDLGPLAVGVMQELMLDPTVSPQTRLTAARDILDRLGWVPPKRADRIPETYQKTIDEMTVDELTAIVRQGQAQLPR